MSTRVSVKQRRSTFHLMTNTPPPYLSRGGVAALIICKWQCQGVKEGRGPCRGHGADEPWGEGVGGGVGGYFLLSVQGHLQKHYISVKLCPFISSYSVSMIQVCVGARRG